jgi:hypothetical protein
MTHLLKRWKGWNMGMEAVMTPHKQWYKNIQKKAAKQLKIISFFLFLLSSLPRTLCHSVGQAAFNQEHQNHH